MKADRFGMPGLALTDHGTVKGLRKFLRTARLYPNIKPIAGCEIYFEGSREEIGKCYHLILLAKNERGIDNLCRMVSIAQQSGGRKPIVTRKSLETFHEGLVCTSACIGGEVAQAILARQS